MASYQWTKWHELVVQEKESVGDQATWKEEGIKEGKDEEECRKFEKERKREKKEGEERKKRKGRRENFCEYHTFTTKREIADFGLGTQLGD